MKKLMFLIVLFSFSSGFADSKTNKCLKAFRLVEPKMFETCQNMAENKGNITAMYVLGNIYYFGLTAEKVPEYNKAQYWYTKAAKEGSLEASYSLGVLHENGQGAEQDFAKAFKWYLSAAEKGHAMSQFNVGNMYVKGAGIKKNLISAFKWYRKAANQDVAEAQLNVANSYARGYGIGQDFVEAYKWYLILKNKGNKQAAKNLIELNAVMKAPDVKKAEELASKWKPVYEYTFNENK